jgi:hypothetical protein
MSHVPFVLSAVVLLVNVAHSVHQLREWRREGRAQRMRAARGRPTPLTAGRPFDLAPVCATY